jgi:hypothetical protein
VPVQCIGKIVAALLIGEIGNFNGFLDYKLVSWLMVVPNVYKSLINSQLDNYKKSIKGSKLDSKTDCSGSSKNKTAS